MAGKYPIHVKYRVFTNTIVNPAYVGAGSRFGLVFTKIERFSSDGLREVIIFQNVGNYVQKQIEILKSKEFQDDSIIVVQESNSRPLARDLGIIDSKESYLFYVEQIQVISNQIVSLTQQMGGDNTNQVIDVLVGVGSLIPKVGLVVSAIGGFLKLFTGASDETIIAQKNLLANLSEQYQFYYSYYEDSKLVLQKKERDKIVEEINEENPKKDEPKSLLGGLSNSNLVLIAIGLLLIFGKKKRKR